MWPTLPNSVQQSSWQGQLSRAGISQELLLFPGYGNPHHRPTVAFQEAECDVTTLSLASASRISNSAPFWQRRIGKKGVGGLWTAQTEILNGQWHPQPFIQEREQLKARQNLL